jgi:diguanylate cyclase (GGDEF)-like protein/PAS domain S-box-containing protein
MRDISQMSKARAQLYRQRRTLSSVAEAIPTFIAVVDKEARYEFVNTAFQELIGRTKEDIVGQRLGDVLTTREVSMRLPAIQEALQGVGSSFELDMFLGGSQRNLVVTLKPRRSENGEPDGFVAVMDDVTTHKQRESRLVRLSEQDALTGLSNRQGFEAFLRSIPPSQGPGTAMLYIDLDRFKPVNDTHGHAVGDQLLKAFAGRLVELVRPTDLVARLGGDEFVLVLAGLPGVEAAQTTADRVVAAASKPFDLHGVEVQVGASVGVAMGGDDDWEGLLQRADAGLYKAKAAGRGRQA